MLKELIINFKDYMDDTLRTGINIHPNCHALVNSLLRFSFENTGEVLSLEPHLKRDIIMEILLFLKEPLENL